MFVQILLDILSILGIIIFGSFAVVVVADLILCLFDDHEGIIFGRNKNSKKSTTKIETKNTEIVKDDIVVYSDKTNPAGTTAPKKENKPETFNGETVQEIDYDKAVEEQKMINKRNHSVSESEQVRQPKPLKKIEPAKKPVNDWDNDDDEFKEMLDDVIKEAKKSGSKSKDVKKEEVKPAKVDDETQKQIDELKALKEQQQKELEEFKKLKEDFAREKEEQLALMKDNLDKAKAEEIEKIKQEAILEQKKIEEETAKIEETKPTEDNKQNSVNDEINKLKYKNLMRMNSRLTRIIRDTEKLQTQKQKELARIAEEKRKLLEKEQQMKLKEQEKRLIIQQQNQERLAKQQEALRIKNEINRKLNDVSKRVGKYKLDSKIVKVSTNTQQPVQEQIVEEVVTTVETIPHSDTKITTVEKTPLVASAKPIFAKEYYEQKLVELEEELKDAEKELRINKSEYIPLTRIHKAYTRDSEKLRKKEILVAKQKVSLYGVNSTKVDPVKKAKLDENLAALSELKDSVEHCEEVIKKNKDRYPVLEKNNKLILKQIDRINDDMKVCDKAISYYNKKK